MATVAASEASNALEKLGMSVAGLVRKCSASLGKQEACPVGLALS